ncbi:MAG: ABC transporter permease subunit [Candidatus Aminicenantes bacterium]|nr:ABC transporter permease subunit [Candidatus Aminicenantes bacterium]
MKIFEEVFREEWDRSLNRWTLFTILAIAVLLGFLLQDGYSRYNASLENAKTFQATEKEKVGQYVLYTQYGAYGIRLMFKPSPMSIFFSNSTVFKDMTANFDSGERLNITVNLKGENLFAQKAGEYMDFSGIINLVGILLALLYGFFGAHNKDYLLFLSCLGDYRTILRCLLISRIILINLVLVALSGLALLWLLILGVPIPVGFFLTYLAVAMLMLSIFVTAGFIIGSVNKTIVGLAFLVVIYFASTFLIPWAVLKITSVNAYDITSNYKMELEKVKLMMDVEKRSYEKVGIYNSQKEAPDDVKQIAREALDNEFKKFSEFENKMKDEMSDKSNFFDVISMLFPTTFYLANNYELSSQGHLNFHDFYAYTIKEKFQFVDFYAEKKIFTKPGDKIESFIKGNENLFVAKSRLSNHFWPGLLISLAWLLGLYFVACHRVKKYLFPDAEYKNAYANLDIDLKTGKYIAFEITQTDAVHQFLNTLSGKGRDFNGKMSIDGEKIVPGKNNDVLIIPNPAAIPGNIPVRTLARFFANMLALSPEDKSKIETAAGGKTGKMQFNALLPQDKVNFLLTVAGLKKCRVYVLYDFTRGLSTRYKRIVKEWVMHMTEQGKMVIDLPELSHLYMKTDYYSGIDFNGEMYEEQKIFEYNSPD